MLHRYLDVKVRIRHGKKKKYSYILPCINMLDWLCFIDIEDAPLSYTWKIETNEWSLI